MSTPQHAQPGPSTPPSDRAPAGSEDRTLPATASPRDLEDHGEPQDARGLEDARVAARLASLSRTPASLAPRSDLGMGERPYRPRRPSRAEPYGRELERGRF